MGNDGHLTAIANAGITDFDSVNHRIGHHFNMEGVDSCTARFIITTKCRVNFNIISSRSIRSCRVNRLVSTENSVGLNHSILIPLIYEEVKVVVLERSGHCYFTAIANGIFSSNNVSDRSFVNHDMERITPVGTTVSVNHFNSDCVLPVDGERSVRLIVEVQQ